MLTNYTINKIQDFLLRGQAFTPPATLYFALVTTASTSTAMGTELSGNAYARVAVTSNMTNWSGTQSAGSTAASSGTSGTISNNTAIAMGTPTPAAWGDVLGWVAYDASTAGNPILYDNFASTMHISNAGSPVSFDPAAITFNYTNV